MPGTLEDCHSLLTNTVAKVLQNSIENSEYLQIPFVVGGGNDQSYANCSALLGVALQLGRPIAVINIDAHLDVRPPTSDGYVVHSGSPFRLMLEDVRFKQFNSTFVEFACQGPQCSLSHAEYVRRNGGRLEWLDKMADSHDPKHNSDPIVSRFSSVLQDIPENAMIFISFDLDAVCAADAPVLFINS